FNFYKSLKLSEPLDLTTNKIQKIALAEKDPTPGKKGRVTGWGFVKKTLVSDHQGELYTTYSPFHLHAVDIKIQQLGVCKRGFKEVPNNLFICAGSDGSTTCEGDSGGPLVVDNKLAGIVSFGYKYCTSLTVYTSAYQFSEWIRTNAAS
ncbi:hypothetical protein KR200_006435, partial [Drosophila serrata]